MQRDQTERNTSGSPRGWRAIGEGLAFAGVLAGVALASFAFGVHSLIFLLPPLSLLALWRLGLGGASTCLAVPVPLASWATLSGLGPLAQFAQPMQALSALLLGCLLCCVGVALAVRRLRADSSAMAELLATVSHDLRTPMHGMLGYADLLQREPLSAEQRSKVDRISESGQRLVGLLNDLLDYSRMEAGALRLDSGPVALADELRWVMALFTPRAAEKGLALTCHVDPAVPALIAGDALRLRQVLLNLVGNAVKFTDQGFVAVTAEARRALLGSELVLTVADSGPGIASAAQAGAFTRFDQAGRTNATARGGAGLGLAICRQLVNLMDGRIELVSQPGQGTRITVCLPLRVMDSPALPAQQTVPERAVNQR